MPVPRPSYPMIAERQLELLARDAKVPDEMREPLVKFLRGILDKQAIDERLNYQYIDNGILRATVLARRIDRTVGNAADTSPLYDTVVSDKTHMAFFDTTDNSYYIRCPVRGIYMMSHRATWDTDPNGIRKSRVGPIGGGFRPMFEDKREPPMTAEETITHSFGIGLCQKGDIISTVVHQTSGGNLNLVAAGGQEQITMGVTLLAAT